MSLRHESVNIRVSQRILWFGAEAYPLHNITRTNTLTLEPKRGAAIRRYAKSVVLWLLATVVVWTVVPTTVAVLVLLAVLAWIVIKTIRLIAFLNLILYELVVETAAGSHRALLSADGKVVSDLSFRITDAINNPLAEFQMRVENIQIGDNVTMFGGSDNTGKSVGNPEPAWAERGRPDSNLRWVEPLVFVNYRSTDEKAATDIEAELTRRLGSGAVFRDARMPAGTEFPRELTDKASRCTVMIAIIGERWDDANGLRLLSDDSDWGPARDQHRAGTPDPGRTRSGRRSRPPRRERPPRGHPGDRLSPGATPTSRLRHARCAPTRRATAARSPRPAQGCAVKGPFTALDATKGPFIAF